MRPTTQMEPRKTSGRQGADLARAGIVVMDAGNLVKDTFFPSGIRKIDFSEDFAMQNLSDWVFLLQSADADSNKTNQNDHERTNHTPRLRRNHQ